MEQTLYRVFRIDPEREMSASVYFICFILFAACGTMLLFAVLLFQAWLPGGPHKSVYLSTPMTVDLAANAAVSFATTTTWQAYRRRNYVALPGPGIRLGGAEFSRRRRRTGSRHRLYSWIRPGTIGHHRQFLRVPASCAQRCGCSCRFRSSAVVFSGLARRAVKSCALHRGAHFGRPAPIDSPGTSSRAGVYQESRNQRRRLFQRQQHPSLRQSNAVDELLALLAIAVLPASLTFTFGVDQAAPLRLGAARRHGRDLHPWFGVCDFAEKSVPANLN